MSQLFYRRILELAEIDDLSSFRSQLGRIGEEMGFGLYSVLAGRAQPRGRWRSAMIHNAAPAWDSAAREVETAARDPFLNFMKRRSVPAAYDQALYVAAQCGDLWEEQAAYGYRTGIGTGLHLPDGRHVLVGFDRVEPLPSDGTKLARLLADLQLLAAHAHEAAFHLLQPPDTEVSLTSRQRDVLRWISMGKSAWTTGQILGLSERTVNGHLAAIYAKVDAGTQAQAVFNAMKLGLL